MRLTPEAEERLEGMRFMGITITSMTREQMLGTIDWLMRNRDQLIADQPTPEERAARMRTRGQIHGTDQRAP